jgi:hypothetical protein
MANGPTFRPEFKALLVREELSGLSLLHYQPSNVSEVWLGE